MNTPITIKSVNISQSLIKIQNEIDFINFEIESINAHNRSQNELLTKKIQVFEESMNKLMIKYQYANQFIDSIYDTITRGCLNDRECVDEIYYKIVNRYQDN